MFRNVIKMYLKVYFDGLWLLKDKNIWFFMMFELHSELFINEDIFMEYICCTTFSVARSLLLAGTQPAGFCFKSRGCWIIGSTFDGETTQRSRSSS